MTKINSVNLATLGASIAVSAATILENIDFVMSIICTSVILIFTITFNVIKLCKIFKDGKVTDEEMKEIEQMKNELTELSNEIHKGDKKDD